MLSGLADEELTKLQLDRNEPYLLLHGEEAGRAVLRILKYIHKIRPVRCPELPINREYKFI